MGEDLDFVLSLEYDATEPLFRRVSDALRKAIIEGRLPAGSPLPSIRDLACSLGVSRSTVLRSFQDLQSQGYVEAKKGLVTSVVRRAPDNDCAPFEAKDPIRPHESFDICFSEFANRMLANEPLAKLEEPHNELSNYGGAPLNLVPIQQWKKLLIDHCRFRDLSRLSYCTDSFGYAPLRESLAAYFSRSRAVVCTAQQVAVFAGRELRLDLICRLLLNEGDNVAVENPGFAPFRHRITSFGANVVPIPVDEFGLDVSHLESSRTKFKFVLVSPSHHEPLGTTMSLERRHQLLKWAQRTQTFIVEDDFDSEYRYGGRPLPSLQGLDQHGLVIYMRCFWRVLFPLMRLGFLIVPERLIEAVRQAKDKVERDPPLLEQFALADFINKGYLERHIHRTQPVYAKKRQSLIYALTRHFGNAVTIRSSSSGLDVLVRFNLPLAPDRILQKAKLCGVSLISTAGYYLDGARDLEFILPFGHKSEEELQRGVRHLADELRQETNRVAEIGGTTSPGEALVVSSEMVGNQNFAVF